MGKERQREDLERERGKREREFLNRILLVVTIWGESAFAEERETDGEKEMFSLEYALIGFAAAVGDSVSRRPAMHVVGSLVAFGLLAVGILLIEVESDVFKLWVSTTSVEILLFFCRRRPSKMMTRSLSSRLVEHHHHHHHHLCVCLRERKRHPMRRRLGEDRQTERARRCWAVRAHLFFCFVCQSRTRDTFFFADADSNRLWERWRRTENVIRWREDERVILTYRQQKTFLSLSSHRCDVVRRTISRRRHYRRLEIGVRIHRHRLCFGGCFLLRLLHRRSLRAERETTRTRTGNLSHYRVHS